MSRKFFGTDGIRDRAGEGKLTSDSVRRIGRAVGRWLLTQRGSGCRVLVGRDTRASGPRLLGELTSGLVQAGHHLVDAGVLPTPGVQTLCREEGFDLAIVISASHNPAEDNGIKFFGADARKLADGAEQAIEELMERDEPPAGPTPLPATRSTTSRRPSATSRTCVSPFPTSI
jgi:phosphoglucosamine mutase